MGMLNTRLEADYSVKLAVRLGIHTGPVVVGEMGGGGRYENLATGETVTLPHVSKVWPRPIRRCSAKGPSGWCEMRLP